MRSLTTRIRPQFLPLHPLTIEDILHQETREKIESFAALGYYFIVFRALDESYFRYTSPTASPSSSSAAVDEMAGGAGTDDEKARTAGIPGASSGRRGRVDIVEGVGGKEGVEGVGVGAVNLYLVVFGDGILSVSSPPRCSHIVADPSSPRSGRAQFHFEPLDQHVERVQGKLQQFGISRNFSSRASLVSDLSRLCQADLRRNPQTGSRTA